MGLVAKEAAVTWLWARIDRPRWAVVVYTDGERTCVLDYFIFRASAAYCAEILDGAARMRLPRTEHRVERISNRPRPGERCVQ